MQRSTTALTGLLLATIGLGAGCPWLGNTEVPDSTLVITDQSSVDLAAGVGGENPPANDEEPAPNDETDAGEAVTTTDETSSETTVTTDTNGLIEPGATIPVNTTPASDTTSSSAGAYLDYAPGQLEQPTGRTLIFFHASWCPTCRALEQDIQANLSAIPADVTILKADFDTELDLRKEYGVSVQSTVVQVDTDANAVTTISGVTRLDALLGRLQ